MTIGISTNIPNAEAKYAAERSYWHKTLNYAVAVVKLDELTLQGTPEDFRTLAATCLEAAERAEAIAREHENGARIDG